MARNNQPEQLQLFFSSRYLKIEQVADIMAVPKSFIYRVELEASCRDQRTIRSTLHEASETTADAEADAMSSLPDGQHIARVSIPEEQWLEFRALAIRKKRSVAAYLGHLVQKEIGRDSRVEERRALRQADQEPEPEDEVDETLVPRWEI